MGSPAGNTKELAEHFDGLFANSIKTDGAGHWPIFSSL